MRQLLNLLRSTRFLKLEIPVRAGALAFQSLLVIVPIFGTALGYLSYIGITDRWLNATKRQFFNQLNLRAGSEIELQFNALTAGVHAKGMGLLGGTILLVAAWSLLSRFAQTLDLILGTRLHSVAFGEWLWLGIRRSAILLLLPISLVVSLFVGQWVQRDSWMRYVFKIHTVGPILAVPIAWFSLTLSFFLVFYMVPSRQIRFAQAMRAALFVAPMTELTRLVFGWLNRYIFHQEKIYGVFAVLPISMLWIYLFWLIVLIGALTLDRSQLFPPHGKSREDLEEERIEAELAALERT